MERTIRITGKAKLSVKPDQVIFTLIQTELKKSFEEANIEVKKAKNELDEVLKILDIETKRLKTLSFSIDPDYISYKENDEYKRKLAGYRYRHEMSLKMDLDNEFINRFLKEIGSMKYNLEFEVNYGVKDEEIYKNELLSRAVQDSKTKASCLTAALGVTLSDVRTIDYSWMDVEISSRAYNLYEEMSDMKLNPEDIEFSDNVTVVWNIE